MPIDFNNATRALQDRNDSRALADRLSAMAPGPLPATAKAMIEAADMFFSRHVRRERPAAGVLQRWVAGVRKNSRRPHAGVPALRWQRHVPQSRQHRGDIARRLAVHRFARPYRYRVNGTAHVRDDDPLRSQYRDALAIVRVEVREAFGNCPRYVHQMQLVAHSAHVPRPDSDVPLTKWKHLEVMQYVLPGPRQSRSRRHARRGRRDHRGRSEPTDPRPDLVI